MKVVAVYNVKGGVGKTSTCVNLAYLAALEGARTLLWDLDPQGAASYLLRIRPRVAKPKRLLRGRGTVAKAIRESDHDGLDLLPADFGYRHIDRYLADTRKPTAQLSRLAKEFEGDYDWLFVDCAPSVSLSAEAIFVAADALLVPVVPTPLSLRSLEQLRELLGKKRTKRLLLLPFFSMVDRRKKIHLFISGEGAPAGMLETHIPNASVIEKTAERRLPLALFAPRSPAADAFRRLWAEVRGSLLG